MNYQKTLQDILTEAVQRQASDVHITVGHAPILRITRTLIDLEQAKFNNQDCRGLAFALMTPEQQRQFLEKKDIDFSFELSEKARFRVNIFFVINGFNKLQPGFIRIWRIKNRFRLYGLSCLFCFRPDGAAHKQKGQYEKVYYFFHYSLRVYS